MFYKHHSSFTIWFGGARWLSGRVSKPGCERSGIQNLPPPCCVLEQDFLLPESTGNTQEAVVLSRHD